MARSVKQINAEIDKLNAEKAEVLTDHINDLKGQAASALQELFELKSLPESVEKALTDKNGNFNVRRAFRKAGRTK